MINLVPDSNGQPSRDNYDLYETGGHATHTAKWRRCTKHVAQNSPGTNEYAVCTAQLGRGGTFTGKSKRKAQT